MVIRKRLFREFKSDFGKYFVILVLLVMTIGLVSGFLVADGSMIKAYNEGFKKYRIEDGHFRLKKKANRMQYKKIEKLGVTLYRQDYVECILDNENVIRIYADRRDVNQECLMEGRIPEKKGELAIDRMYADNNRIHVGDRLASGKRSWVVTGLVALPDYSCLFQKNTDPMFDAVKFSVAIVSQEEFERFEAVERSPCYAWKYNEKPESEKAERERSEDLMKKINGIVSLEEYVPQYENQAIHFTGDDMGSDRTMILTLLYIIIVIMAFVFGVTMNHTIGKEAGVIGTLRAMGYTRWELVRHYMAVPVTVTFAGAILGNILGYTVFKGVCADLYYGSYSLPTYMTVWNAEAFVLTTVIPLALMGVINFGVLWWKLSLSPLQFLRRDLRRRMKKHAIPLRAGIPFFSRFRMRVIFQNMSSYMVLFVGIMFANLLLMFGLVFPDVLGHYQEQMKKNLLCNYQYILQAPVNLMNDELRLDGIMDLMLYSFEIKTENRDAEAFSVYSLNTTGEKYKSEEVLLYGIAPQSRYIALDTKEGEVYISSAYQEKFKINPGDEIVLKEKYKEETYAFRVAGVYDYEGALAVFMSQRELNQTFDLGSGYFGGYFSNSEITDIEDKYISTVIDLESLTKISRQLDVSMGQMMYLIDGFAVCIFVILIYLLSRLIIEKNSHAISMIKILGYTNPEIGILYLLSTSAVVVLFLLVSLPIEYWMMEVLFRKVMLDMITGWIPFTVSYGVFVKMFVLGMVSYGVVAAFEYQKIQRIPMDQALKNME